MEGTDEAPFLEGGFVACGRWPGGLGLSTQYSLGRNRVVA